MAVYSLSIEELIQCGREVGVSYRDETLLIYAWERMYTQEADPFDHAAYAAAVVLFFHIFGGDNVHVAHAVVYSVMELAGAEVALSATALFEELQQLESGAIGYAQLAGKLRGGAEPS